MRDTIVELKLKAYKPRMQWQEFRDEVLWSQEVNFFFADNVTYLASFYKEFSQFKNSKWVF